MQTETLKEDQHVFAHVTRDVLDGTPGILGLFDERALLSARRNDIVILLGRTKAPTVSLLLCELGIGPDPKNIRFSLRGLEGRKIHPFSGTSKFLMLEAKKHGCCVLSPGLDTAWRSNDKGVLQVCAGAKKLPVPAGCVVKRGKLKETVARMLQEGHPLRIKGTRSASGLAQVSVFPEGDFPEYILSEAHEFVVQRLVFSGVRREELLDVSVQLEVSEGEKTHPKALFLFGQHIDDAGHHEGNYLMRDGILSPKTAKKIRESAEDIAGHIRHATGYFGPASIDFLVHRSTGEFYALDPNFRVVAPWYPVQAMLGWWGKVLPFDMWSFKVPRGVTLKTIKNIFGGMLLNVGQGDKTGFVPFCLLPEHEFCYGLAVAEHFDDLAVITQDAKRRITNLLKHQSTARSA